MIWRFLRSVAVYSTLALLPFPAVFAQQDSVDTAAARAAGTRGVARTSTMPDVARDVINQTMSPFCPGLTLAACPSPSADSLRRVVVALAEKGEGRQQILDRLSEAYGDRVLGSPRKSGVGLLAWLMPAAILLFGGFWVRSWLRRSTLDAEQGIAAGLSDADSLAEETRSASERLSDSERESAEDRALRRQLEELLSSDDR